MNVGARFALARSEPNAAAVQMTTKSATDSPLTTTRRYGESRKRWRPSGNGRPAPGLELRLRPERAERDERDDEDGGSADEEQPAGNGEVADAADAVRSGGRREGERGE